MIIVQPVDFGDVISTQNATDHNLLLDSIRPSLPFTSQSKNCRLSKIFLSRSPVKSLSGIPQFVATLRMSQSTPYSVVQQQRVVIPNKHGEKLVGVLHETGSLEIVILCHAFQCDKEHYTMVNLAAALEKEGISAFRFDFAGNGQSEGTFQLNSYWREADDLRAVIEHFNGANRVISAIVGHSKGAGVVLLYASKYNDVHTVVNVSSRYDLKRGIEERLGNDFMRRIKEDGYVDVKIKSGTINHHMTWESLMDCLNTNMHEACLQIDKSCRVLTVHGSADELVPVADAQEFAKTIPNHKLQIVEGANHVYISHQAELTSIVSSFIKRSLEEDREKKNPASIDLPHGHA